MHSVRAVSKFNLSLTWGLGWGVTVSLVPQDKIRFHSSSVMDVPEDYGPCIMLFCLECWSALWKQYTCRFLYSFAMSLQNFSSLNYKDSAVYIYISFPACYNSWCVFFRQYWSNLVMVHLPWCHSFLEWVCWKENHVMKVQMKLEQSFGQHCK